MLDIFTKVPTFLAALLGIISCTNNYSQTDIYLTRTASLTEIAIDVDTSLKDKLFTIATATEDVQTGQEEECKPFVPPKTKPIPELPSIEEQNLTDPEVIEQVLIEHIATLRMYLIDQEESLEQAYLQYKTECEIIE